MKKKLTKQIIKPEPKKFRFFYVVIIRSLKYMVLLAYLVKRMPVEHINRVRFPKVPKIKHGGLAELVMQQFAKL